MIVANIYKNLCRSRSISQYGRSLVHLYNTRTNISTRRCDSTTRPNTDTIILNSTYRNYSTETEPKTESMGLPPLSSFPPVLWPQLFTTLKNFFIINMVIKSQIDKEFNETEFISATKQALVVISAALANEDYQRLDGLVTLDIIDLLKENITKLSSEQKRCIGVREEDIYLSYPSDITIKNDERDRKFVEISVVHHYMQGFGRMKERGEFIAISALQDHQDKIFVANYRFLREYTDGSDSSWIVNAVNHFSPNLAYGYQQATK